ncbi:single-stranded DNA-binding protein [Melioribacter sp. OK-6-Me]|uniref:single-stranded DNA-binding protein n=1 Tax=unclassified Melioribacter TaxID=2627329 RepID=UPI003EDA21A2
MAFSLNKIMLIGNLGSDAETRFTTNNVSVTTFSLATTRSYKGRDGNWVNETTWHNVVAYNLSDFYKDALKKGKKFYIEGRISKRDYEDKNGIKRYFTEVVAEQLIPLDSREAPPETGGEEIQGDAPAMEADSDEDLPF